MKLLDINPEKTALTAHKDSTAILRSNQRTTETDPLCQRKGGKTPLINGNETQRNGKIWDKRNEPRVFLENRGVKRNSE